MNRYAAEGELVFVRGVGEPDEMLRLPHSGDQLGVDQCVGLAGHQAAHDENADLRAESAEGHAFFDGGDAEPFCAGLNQPGSAGGKAVSVGICLDYGQQIGGCGVVRAALRWLAGGEQRPQIFEIGDESRAGNFYSSNWGRQHLRPYKDFQIECTRAYTSDERRRWGHCAAWR